MKYPFRVKHDGKYYKSGEDVPTGASSAPVVEVKTEAVQAVENAVKPTTDADKPEYTKSDITRMNSEKLRKLAAEVGIADADDYTGGELKKMLIERLGL